MILGKIVIEGKDSKINEEIADAIFAYLKNKKQLAIFLDNYKDDQNNFILGDGDVFVVCMKR